MNWLERHDVKLRGRHLFHVHAEGGKTTEGRVQLREIALEDFDPVPSGEPLRLRVAACERCGAVLAVISVVRP
jgi:hypothetical protein